MTPNRATGEIHGVINPVIENSLQHGLIFPSMLDHSAAGLVASATAVFDYAGIDCDQQEGISVERIHQERCQNKTSGHS